jgi:hypothetical protein
MLEKTLQIVAACAVWINYAGEILKKDKRFYKQKNKQLLNALLDNNINIIKESKHTEALVMNNPKIKANLEMHYREITGEDIVYETDSAVEDLNLMQEMFGTFLEIYLSRDTVSLVEFFIQLRSIRDKEKLYTEQELKWFCGTIASKVCSNTVHPDVINSALEDIKTLKFKKEH